jgi:hypothetical protein
MNDQVIERRSVLGKKVALRNGGWLRVRPRVDNIDYTEKRRRLEAAIRSERDIAPDADLVTALGLHDYLDFENRALIGPVITAWGAFDDEDGNELPWHLEGSSLPDETIGCMILLLPGVGNDFMTAMKPIDDAHMIHYEVMEKNSSEPSVGNSATEGSLTPTDPN